MLKLYVERGEDDNSPGNAGGAQDGGLVQAGTGIMENLEDHSVHDEELLKLGCCYQQESIQDIKLGVDLSEAQQREIMGTLRGYSDVFTDVPGKSNLIEHHINLTDVSPVRSKP